MKENVFNTGKVLIGLAYEQDKRPTMSDDEIRIQTAYLDKKPKFYERYGDQIIVVISVLALIAAAFSFAAQEGML